MQAHERHHSAAFELFAMRLARPIATANFIHGIICYSLLLPLIATKAAVIFVINSCVITCAFIGISKKSPLLLLPNIFVKVAIAIVLPLLTLPYTHKVAANGEESSDIAMVTWLGTAVLCFLCEEHVMFVCFTYLMRRRGRKQSQSDEEDQPPSYAVAIGAFTSFGDIRPPPYFCPSYSTENSAPSNSTSWPSA
uniref:Uncharacterized protein n=1 Tax=Plectus sambesii TaxID=2011161 RepID=A0A914WLT7_9BILA